jgi:hypothetical protein
MLITVDNIMDLDPCEDYTREDVEELWDGRESLSLVDICDLDIPPADIFWVVTLFLPDRENRLFAVWCAERVLPIFETRYPDDKRPRMAIETARRYANGEATKDELNRARDAAWAAGATGAAAWAARAARSAAWAEARSAARSAAREAESAWAAAWAEARAAEEEECEKQLKELRRVCAEMEGKDA